MSTGILSLDIQAVAITSLLRRCGYKLVFMAVKPQTIAKIQLSCLNRNMQQL